MVGFAQARRGFTLIELLVVVFIVGIILLALGRFFLNYYSAAQETQVRLRLQRDMRTLSYWVRKDLSALAVRNNNFDLKNGAFDFAFLGADDPNDTQDWIVNTTDADLDRFTYTFSANKVIRTQDPLGIMTAKTSEITLEALEPARGDTWSVEILLYDLDTTLVTRSDYDGVLGNFDYSEPIRRVEVEIIFSKRPSAIFGLARPPIIERSRIKTVAFYRRSG